jgi:hypothetical protein
VGAATAMILMGVPMARKSRSMSVGMERIELSIMLIIDHEVWYEAMLKLWFVVWRMAKNRS